MKDNTFLSRKYNDLFRDKYEDIYTKVDSDNVKAIRENYKIIEVGWLDPFLIKFKMSNDEYFKQSPQKVEIVNNMVQYYLNNQNKSIYKKTDYLCNTKEKLCICNIHAEDLRNIYDTECNEEDIFISWIKLKKDNF